MSLQNKYVYLTAIVLSALIIECASCSLVKSFSKCEVQHGPEIMPETTEMILKDTYDHL